MFSPLKVVFALFVLEVLHVGGLAPNSKKIPAASCAEILQNSPDAASGFYWVKDAAGKRSIQYCDMTRTCLGVTGGWARVANLDMTVPSHQCPTGFDLRTDYSMVRRACVLETSFGTCGLIEYPSHIVQYSKVCGRVFGFYGNSLDGFGTSVYPPTLFSSYVDGVSLTTNGEHIWTFAAHETRPPYECDCGDVPSFVGNDYFCDVGGRGEDTFYNALWDGYDCIENECCTLNGPPWFEKQLNRPTADDIVARVCRDQPSIDEQMPISKIEIYVQ